MNVRLKGTGVLDFNTSYVMVQLFAKLTNVYSPFLFQYILCYGSTLAIHFPCLQQLQFQYILCYGST